VSKSKQFSRDQRAIDAPLLRAVQELAKRDLDAFVILYFHAMVLLMELDRAGYEYLTAGVMAETFRDCGFLEALEQLKQKLDSGDLEGALERLEAIKTWERSIEKLASQERFQVLLAEHEQAVQGRRKGVNRVFVM
jgi:hypothetical protein